MLVGCELVTKWALVSDRARTAAFDQTRETPFPIFSLRVESIVSLRAMGNPVGTTDPHDVAASCFDRL